MNYESMDNFADVAYPSFPADNDDLLQAGSDWHFIAILDLPLDAWLSYIQGYRLAANIIKDHIADVGYDQDFLIWPFVMSWRHHVELQLKNLTVLLERLCGSSPQIPGTHKLDLLWERFYVALQASNLDDSDDTGACENAKRVILQLNSIDPLSQMARYPVDRRGEATDTRNSPRIHIRHFNDVMERVANYLDALDTGARETLSAMAEVADYFYNG